jgi:hypothetical protein
VLCLEEVRFDFVYRIQTDDFSGRDERHAHPVAYMVGAGDELPFRFAMRIRNDEALLSTANVPEKEIHFPIQDDCTRVVDVLVAFVTPESANDKAPVRVTQHHIRTVVGNQLGEVIEQRFENSFKTEVLRQRDVGVSQDLSLLPYGMFARQ